MIWTGDGVNDVWSRLLPWKMSDDKGLVCLDGGLMPLCNVLHKMSAEKGLVDFQILDHVHTPKMRNALR